MQGELFSPAHRTTRLKIPVEPGDPCLSFVAQLFINPVPGHRLVLSHTNLLIYDITTREYTVLCPAAQLLNKQSSAARAGKSVLQT